jgi:hypothetical protein
MQQPAAEPHQGHAGQALHGVDARLALRGAGTPAAGARQVGAMHTGGVLGQVAEMLLYKLNAGIGVDGPQHAGCLSRGAVSRPGLDVTVVTCYSSVTGYSIEDDV